MVKRYKITGTYSGLDYVEIVDGKEFDVLKNGSRVFSNYATPERLKTIEDYVQRGSWIQMPDYEGVLNARNPGEKLYALIRAELDRAYAKHGNSPWGRHEFFGVLKEEVDELWDDVKADAPQEQLLKELVQVAAMCFRYFETGDRQRGAHPSL